MTSHTGVETWSRGASPLHRRDARAKLLALLTVLIALATAPHGRFDMLLAIAALVAAGVAMARLPAFGVLLRAAAVLPFAGTAAVAAAWTSGPAFGAFLLGRSYVSAAAVVLLAGVTPAPALFAALRWFRVPRELVLTIEFLYRFLALTGEQATRLRWAADARRGAGRHRRGLRKAASGAVATLFASAYERAQRVHRSMLSRGFTGEIRLLARPRLHASDWAFAAAVAGLALAIRSR